MQNFTKFILALCLALLAAPVLADGWNVAETAHFRIYSKGPSAELSRRAAMLEDYRILLEASTNRGTITNAEPKLDIFLVDNMPTSRPFTPMSKLVAGIYIAAPTRIAAYADSGDKQDQTTLLHEYAHHFMLGTAGAVAYPAWYVEGFAEYFSTARFSPQTIEVGDVDTGRTSWLVYSDKWLPLEKILSGDYSWRSGDEVSLFYAQSWLMTHYMYRTPELTPKLGAYLAAVAAGEDSVAAFKQHVSDNLSGFQRLLRAYLMRQKLTYTRYTRSPKTPASVVVTPLSAAADPMLLQLTNLEFGVGGDAQDKAMATIKASAAKFPGDPLAERTLAYAELRYGDRADAIARLDRLIAAAPKDATLLRWRGEAELPGGSGGMVSAEELKAARVWFARAFKSNPEDWRTLYLYAMLENPYGGALKPQTLDVLLRAHELAPQVDQIGMAAALGLARANRMPEAAAKLAPIANDPHGGSLGDAAANLLPIARAGDATAFFAALDAARDERGAAGASENGDDKDED
jgi:tetratricopeptide (TPR) repeat protein